MGSEGKGMPLNCKHPNVRWYRWEGTAFCRRCGQEFPLWTAEGFLALLSYVLFRC